ncbi:MAG TPA: DUF4173 domain-containing protein [Candidatus Limnocylindrales bacterium]|nr:DUF4173 domain-containing protein [Candidatus Limnocylindrales bacterium]
MEHRIAHRVLGIAALAGIVAELLFDRQPLGVGVPLFAIAVLAGLAALAPSGGGGRPIDALDWWLPVTAVAASLGPGLRTDPTVVVLDLVLVVAAVAGWSAALSGVAVTRRSAAAVTTLGVAAGLAMLAAPVWLVRRIAGDGVAAASVARLGQVAPFVRGLVIAVPIVAAFAFLLGSADAVFGHVIDAAFRVSLDLDDAAGRTGFTLLAAAILCGPLAVAAGIVGSAGFPIATFGTPAVAASEPLPAPTTGPRSGATEAIVVLIAVDLLFAAFAAVQVVFLFGSTDTLAAIGMTYSDYARQGYFQLVGVVALAGLLVMGAHHVVGRTRGFLVAALVLLGLTGLILVSAAIRLALYQGAYGWTELRFFVAASIAWLGLAVMAAIVLLAAARMRWLPHALAMSAVGVTLAVSAIGPQAFVMQENVTRVLDPSRVAPGGHAGIDLDYGTSLGDDAIPALVSVLPSLPPEDRASLVYLLQLRRIELEAAVRGAGPLSWNVSRDRALAALDRSGVR